MLKPIGDRIVVAVDAAEETTKSGIILPDSAKEKKSKGRVVAVGLGSVLANGTRSPIDVAVGNTVIFSQYGGTEVTEGDETYLILRESDILAVVE